VGRYLVSAYEVVDVQPTTFWNAGQSWLARRVVRINTRHLVEAEVRVNAYDFQSYARARHWSGREWKWLCGIPTPEMLAARSTPNDGRGWAEFSLSYTQVTLGPEGRELLERDLERLIDLAADMIDGWRGDES
jgi:hypothetical protein